MRYIFYDVETTGFAKQDEVIQFGAVVTDGNLKVVGKVMFYCYTQVPIRDGAYKVHGIKKERLYELSGGRTFEDYFLGNKLFYEPDLVWVSYSTNGFDERLVNNTLTNNGLARYDFGSEEKYLGQFSKGRHWFNACHALANRCNGGKVRKLSQLVEKYGITDKEEYHRKLFGLKASFHDATYDAFMMWVLVFLNRRMLGFNELH